MTTNSVEQNGYIVYSTPYRNNSLLLTVLMMDGNLVKGILNGGKKKGIDLFSPYWLVYQDKSNLVSFYAVESCGIQFSLHGKRLFCGLYLNELLVRLLTHQQPISQLFSDYQDALRGISQSKVVEPSLRIFERSLIDALGYGIDFEHIENGEAINKKESYFYTSGSGFRLAVRGLSSPTLKIYSGENLLAIAQNNYQSEKTLRVAKDIFRQTVSDLLQGSPLRSRDLFKNLR